MNMDYKSLLKTMGFSPKEGAADVYIKEYKQHDYSVEIDLKKEQICYGGLIGADCKTTQNFSQAENLVVLECVDRLLEKGYKPQNIILEKTWAAGRGTSGRLDICVTRDDGSEYLLIECKTYGKEFDKAVSKLKKDGGQLFTYFKFSNKADVIMLYTSELKNGRINYKNEIIKIEDDYRTGDVKDFYEKWNKLTKDNGIFEIWVEPYCFESKALTIDDLKKITQDDSSFIFNQFAEILRHNVVSDKGNAFNKIFTLFLCKVYDETTKKKGDGKELDFQWKEGIDNHIDFQLRLTDLYKKGMYNFLDRKVSDFEEQEFENKCKDLSEDNKKYILNEINKIRLQKNNEFAIKEVYDESSFLENAKIVKEVVQLLEKYQIRYNERQQYLSDFFELLLTTGLKQEAGQFFTPVPIAQFIIRCLPLEKIIDEKLKSKSNEILPYMIDYASGSGHFITEYMHEVQKIIETKDPADYISNTEDDLIYWNRKKYQWATKYVYGIEKDYRLVKVGKVGCYLHGDGLANVILSDGLGSFTDTKDFKGKLHKENNDNLKDNQQFDILLSNPPYSVSAFRQAARDYYTEKDFELYDKLTDNSSEIECLFVERAKQLLKDGGIAGIILPGSILTNTGIYTKTREIILKYFEITAIAELGSNTFMATGTNTVVLFLRRRNNYECINLEKSVDKFFSNHTDVTINGIEKPILKYVNYVWEGLSFEDYLTLLNENPNDKVKNHDLFKEYKQKITSKSDKEFWNKIKELEKEKIYYFILAYPQQLVIVKAGEKEAEKQFLGYEFSNRRGSEGIHPINRNSTIDECTRLFDINSFYNPQKASTYILKAFEGDFDSKIDETLKDNISRINLLDIMTFDRTDFEKVINTKIKKKIRIESRWNIVKIGDIADTQYGYTAKAENKGAMRYLRITDINDDGSIKNREIDAKYISPQPEIIKQFLLNDGDIVAARSGSVGKTALYNSNKYEKMIFASYLVRLSADKKYVLPEYLFYFTQTQLYWEQVLINSAAALQPNLNAEKIKEIKMPLPPLDIQQKIADEIEKIDKQNNLIKNKIEKYEIEINSILEKIYKGSEFRTLDEVSREISAGGDVPKGNWSRNLSKEYSIPIYSNGIGVNALYGYTNIDKIKEDAVSISARGTIGYTAIRKAPFYPIVRLIIVIPDSAKISLKYLYYTSKKLIINPSGKTIPQLTVPMVKPLKIPYISLKEQEKIVSQIEEIEKQIAEAQSVIDNSKQLKQAVLDKYLK